MSTEWRAVRVEQCADRDAVMAALFAAGADGKCKPSCAVDHDDDLWQNALVGAHSALRSDRPDCLFGAIGCSPETDTLLFGEEGNFLDALHHIMLPAFVLGTIPLAVIVRMTRSSMLEVLNEDYIRTARAKGLSRLRVVVVHALRNAMIAPFTVLLLQLNFLISGVVVTELVFAYPGFGRMLLEASLFGDISTVEAATLVTVAVAIVTQLLGDLGYMALNPRIRLR